MKLRTSLRSAALAFILLTGIQHSASAQVVEGRESEANPAGAVFRATLYGAGTGLALGGAYALIEDSERSTSEILRWSTAIGTAGGLLIGLIYVATRSDPEGSVGEVGMLQLEHGELRVSPMILTARRLDLPGPPVRTLDVNLVRVGF